jgi:predicted metallo-beta-lactamase superfamily hydrolase
MKVVPLAFESTGVRSMCTFVQTDQGILIDPGTSIAPKRFSLPPSIPEFEALHKSRNRIWKYSEKSSVITVSHYHHDHFTPFEKNIYLESSPISARTLYHKKKLFLKNPDANINKNQKSRAENLLKNLKYDCECEINFSDGNEYQLGDTTLNFSPALSHGSDNSRLGYVVALSISYNGEKLMHASDVQGPISKQAFKYILQEKPDILILSGPPLYLLGYVLSKEDLNDAQENLKELTKHVSQVIVDHHVLRNQKGLGFIENLDKSAPGKVQAASEICGKEPLLLESQRKILNKKSESIQKKLF